jgi:hypothetical protein
MPMLDLRAGILSVNSYVGLSRVLFKTRGSLDGALFAIFCSIRLWM